MLPSVILLTSPAPQSGKSTAAQYLEEEYDYVRVKFADPLKNMCRTFLAALGMTDAEIEEAIEGELKEAPLRVPDCTPRHLMQTLGTEWGRMCLHQDVWVDMALDKVARLASYNRRVVIDDARFPNEIQKFRDHYPDTAVLCIRRFFEKDNISTHSSEGALSSRDIDFIVDNYSDELADFHRNLDQALEFLS